MRTVVLACVLIAVSCEVRAPRPGTTCDALDREIYRADIAIATCTLTTRAAGAGSR